MQRRGLVSCTKHKTPVVVTPVFAFLVTVDTRAGVPNAVWTAALGGRAERPEHHG